MSSKSRRSKNNGKRYCAIVGCHNHEGTPGITFTVVPAASRDPERRRKWIEAINRVNPDGSEWIPSQHSVVCSAHFVSGVANRSWYSQDYVPSLFLTGLKQQPLSNRREQKIHREDLLQNDPLSADTDTDQQELDPETPTDQVMEVGVFGN